MLLATKIQHNQIQKKNFQMAFQAGIKLSDRTLVTWLRHPETGHVVERDRRTVAQSLLREVQGELSCTNVRVGP